MQRNRRKIPKVESEEVIKDMSEVIRENLDTSLVRQSRVAYDIIKAVFNHVGECWDALTMREIFDAREIIITGCGDSYCAALAAKPLFEEMVKVPVRAMRCIEVSRNMDRRAFGYANNSPLVIGISVSGTVSRVEEALKRAALNGANTLAVTDNPDSPVGKAAKHVVHIGLPKDQEYGPGSNSYNGSLIALMALAIRMGRVKNNIPEEKLFEMRDSILEYAKACQDVMEKIGDKAFEVAKIFKDMKAIDFIGDYGDYATAFFGSAKVLETYGGYTTYDDLEDWCHISFFNRRPKNMATVLVANESSRSFSRDVETVGVMDAIKRPIMVVTDSETQEFPESVCVFRTPKPKYRWANALLQHLPIDFVAAYIGIFKKADAYNMRMRTILRMSFSREMRTASALRRASSS